ncbi:charged multivesicular body protein 4b-like isoform X2 [Symsagittifera roscoffensis]|uniref:charged multivesicular body protein 4b-like isoform X2 n=1 Tax=Symsagittifera roscoffensis TaxID=84072 RepID=UPI00307C1BF5
MPLLGKSKKPTNEDAIQNLRSTKELLERKQAHLEKQIEQSTETARKLARTDKRKALLALKQKKKYDAQLKQCDGVLSNMDLLLDQLEQSQMTAQVTKAMHQAATSLQQTQKANNLDKLEDMMYDIEEQISQGEQINDALSRQIGFGANDVDEDDLEAELNDLMQEDLDAQMLDIAAVPSASLPNVPTTSLPAQEEDDDLNELRAFAEAQ